MALETLPIKQLLAIGLYGWTIVESRLDQGKDMVLGNIGIVLANTESTPVRFCFCREDDGCLMIEFLPDEWIFTRESTFPRIIFMRRDPPANPMEVSRSYTLVKLD